MSGIQRVRAARWAGEVPPFSALRALAVTAASMVLSEIIAMEAVSLLRLASPIATTLVDALIMITLGFPVLYALTFRPLVNLAEGRARAQVALEVTNAELELANRAERDARDAAETLRSAAVAMTQGLDIEARVRSLLEHVANLVPYHRARVILVEGAQLRTLAIARRGRPIEFLREGSPAFERSADPVLDDLLASGEGIILSDTHAHPVWGPRMSARHDHSWMGIPLLARDRTIGLYTISRFEPGAFTAEDLRVAEALSAPAAVAIENAALVEQLKAERERLQTLSRKLVDLQEKERRAIARELHDDTGQTLTSLKIGLRLLEQETADPRIVSRAAELRRIADDVQEGLHRLAANLRPPALEHVGLVAALRQLAEDLTESSGVRIELETVGCDGERLPWRAETDLFRIAQEALTNALRHAQAGEVSMVLDRRNGRVRLMVEDDGRGFHPGSVREKGRLGLVGMRERAEILGGTLLVESSPGSGTTVVVEAPLGS